MITLAKIKRFRRFFARHRVLLSAESSLVWLVLVAAIFYAISFFVIPAAAEATLQKLCGGAVDIQSGRFKGFDAIRLNGIVMGEDSRAMLNDPILKADQIEVQFDLWQLLRGKFSVHSIVLSDFLLTADYNASSKEWNLGGLSFQKTNFSGRQIPLLDIQQATVRLRQKKAGITEILTTVGINGQIAIPAEKNEYRFSLETDGRFGFGESNLKGGFRLGDDGKQSHFFATGQILMPAAGILQNKWDMKDIKLEAVFDEKTIAIKQSGFSIGQGRAEFDGVIGRTGHCPMELNVALHGLTLSDRDDPGTLSYGWLLESSDTGFARFLRRFHPAGAGELDISITAELDNLSQTRLDGLILCKDISICDDQFPYKIEKMQGDIEFAGRAIRLKQIQARHGDIHLLIDGGVANFGPEASIYFRVTSDDMRFDDDLYQSLSAKAKKAWYDFAPEGLAETDYYFERMPDGQEKKEVSLKLKNMSAIYKHFPYPLKNLTGKIVLRPGELFIEDVLTNNDNRGQIKVVGRVLQREETESVFDVHILGKAIPVDRQLIRALPKKYGAFFDPLEMDEVEAVADFVVTVFPDKADKRFLDYSAEIGVEADAFSHDEFPLPMTDVELTATVTENVVLLKSFLAQTESGPIRIGKSQLWSQGADPNRPGICLDLDLKGFDLNEPFWAAVGQEMRGKLGNLGLRGRVNATGQLAVNVPKAECAANDLIIDCNDNPLTWNDAVLGRANGRLHIRDDRVTFSGFEVADIPLASLPKERLSENAAGVLTQIDPKGKVSIYLEDGLLKIGPNGPEQIDVHAKVNADELSFGQTDAVSGLGGDCQGHFVFDFETRRWQALVHYDIDQFTYRDRLVTGLSGDLVFDPNSMQLASEGFTAALYDGGVIGNLGIILQPDELPRYQLELNYDGVNIQMLLAAGEKMPSQGVMQGVAAGRLALEGDIGDFSTSRGTFETVVVDLEMGRQTLLGKILTAVQLKRPENFVFSEIDVSAAILGPELVFNHIRMLGSPLIFYGQGKVNFQSRQIDMELASWDQKNGSEKTILEALTRGIGSALWKVQVRGTLDTPEVDAVYLSVLKQPLNIFKKKE
ncbi:MAG: hypothetical protein B6I25_06300 [Planctomycetales bacterium 4572_13]|nr:MAG: hypothetical protein B6I25_06300 [Planctomycetales bacterium 4572_13]